MLHYLIYTFFFNNRLKLVKNYAKAKQNPESELLLFENYLLSSCSKVIEDILKNVENSKRRYSNEIISIIMKMNMKKDHIDTV